MFYLLYSVSKSQTVIIVGFLATRFSKLDPILKGFDKLFLIKKGQKTQTGSMFLFFQLESPYHISFTFPLKLFCFHLQACIHLQYLCWWFVSDTLSRLFFVLKYCPICITSVCVWPDFFAVFDVCCIISCASYY